MTTRCVKRHGAEQPKAEAAERRERREHQCDLHARSGEFGRYSPADLSSDEFADDLADERHQSALTMPICPARDRDLITVHVHIQKI